MRAWIATAMVVAAACELAMAQQGRPYEPAKKPKEFPSVAVTPGVTVNYAHAALDTWTGKVAYLLVEGNSSNGYTRMFAWIPDDSRFGRPQEFKPKVSESNPNAWIFGELRNTDAFGDEKVNMLYRFSTARQSRGAGSSTSTDYATGKTVTRNWGASTWHEIRYGLIMGYAFGSGPSGTMDGSYPLEMAHGDHLRLYDSWAKVPEPGGGGFGASIQAKHTLQETRDAHKGRLLCEFGGFSGLSIRKAPPGGTVTFTVSPYMKEAVYTNTMTLGDFMQKGFDTEIPYGWYTLQLRGFRYGRFGFGGDVTSARTLIPLNRPPPQGR